MWGKNYGFWRDREAMQLTLVPEEAGVLGGLAEAMLALVGPAVESPTSDDPFDQLVGLNDDVPPPEEPTDPAVHRLFPSAYADDDESSADFRRFTEPGLRQLKASRITKVKQLMMEFGAPGADAKTVDISTEEAQDFLGAINDMRLVLGSRLDITEDREDIGFDWDADDPRRHQYDVYQWLTWLQSTLLEVIVE